MQVLHGDVSTALRSTQHDRKIFPFFNLYVFVILILPLALAREESQKHTMSLKNILFLSALFSDSSRIRQTGRVRMTGKVTVVGFCHPELAEGQGIYTITMKNKKFSEKLLTFSGNVV